MKTSTFMLPVGYVDKEGVLHRECTVRIMDGNIEEEISDKKIASNGAKVITKLLGSCIIKLGDIENPKGVGEFIAREMFVGDRDMALIEVRKISLGATFEMGITCPNGQCRDKFDIGIDFDVIEVVNWDAEANPLYKGETGYLEFELPDGLDFNGNICKKGKLYIPTGKVEENIANLIRSNSAKANTSLLAACIKELEGTKMVNVKDVQRMSRRDRDYLTQFIRKNQPGPKMLVDTICPSCIEEFEVPIQLPYFFTNSLKG